MNAQKIKNVLLFFKGKYAMKNMYINNFYIRESYVHVENLRWKKMLYIITLFHSVVINKSFIGSEDNNENLLLDLNRTNLNSSLAVLEATLEKMPNETDVVVTHLSPWESKKRLLEVQALLMVVEGARMPIHTIFYNSRVK